MTPRAPPPPGGERGGRVEVDGARVKPSVEPRTSKLQSVEAELAAQRRRRSGSSATSRQRPRRRARRGGDDGAAGERLRRPPCRGSG